MLPMALLIRQVQIFWVFRRGKTWSYNQRNMVKQSEWPFNAFKIDFTFDRLLFACYSVITIFIICLCQYQNDMVDVVGWLFSGLTAL